MEKSQCVSTRFCGNTRPHLGHGYEWEPHKDRVFYATWCAGIYQKTALARPETRPKVIKSKVRN